MAHGKYEGRALVELLDDGRRVRLRSPFSYLDPRGERWNVPRNAIVDGASIPRILWTLIGGPFEGKYRKASIVHDWYCDLRVRPWRLVHRMFYDAMITSSASMSKARLLYAGVYLGGPRWSETVVENVKLANHRGWRTTDHDDYQDGRSSGGSQDRGLFDDLFDTETHPDSDSYYRGHARGREDVDRKEDGERAAYERGWYSERLEYTAISRKPTLPSRRYEMDQIDLDWLSAHVREDAIPLDAIEKMVDERLAARTPVEFVIQDGEHQT